MQFKKYTFRKSALRFEIFWRSFLALLFSFYLFLFSTQAVLAANITVNGISYDIQFTGGSYNENAALLNNVSTAPWWGNRDLAFDFANAYKSQVGNADISPITSGTDELVFAYSTGTEIRYTETNYVLSRSPQNLSQAFSYRVFAYVPGATSVPEINSGALSQVSLILFALWLVVRRRQISTQSQ